MKIETTPAETAVIIIGIVVFVVAMFVLYHREQLRLTRTEEGRLQLE